MGYSSAHRTFTSISGAASAGSSRRCTSRTPPPRCSRKTRSFSTTCGGRSIRCPRPSLRSCRKNDRRWMPPQGAINSTSSSEPHAQTKTPRTSWPSQDVARERKADAGKHVLLADKGFLTGTIDSRTTFEKNDFRSENHAHVRRALRFQRQDGAPVHDLRHERARACRGGIQGSVPGR